MPVVYRGTQRWFPPKYIEIILKANQTNLYLCDFAKRCPLRFRLNTGIARVQASVAGKKNHGACCLARCQQKAQPRPICGWVADLLCVKTRGVGRGDFVTLIRVSCQKAVQSQRIFPAG